MFNLRLCNAAIIRYSTLKFGHVYLCVIDFKYFSTHCCKCNSFGCTASIRCGNACHRPHSDSLYSGSEHSQLNSPRLVKREAGFPDPRRALIDSNQLWRVNDSPYYREYHSWETSRISPSQASYGVYSIARLWGRDTGYLPWVQILIDVLPQLLHSSMKYHVLLDRAITVSGCIGVTVIYEDKMVQAVHCCHKCRYIFPYSFSQKFKEEEEK